MILEILKFIFSSFWVWAGGLIYLIIICAALAQFRLFDLKDKH